MNSETSPARIVATVAIYPSKDENSAPAHQLSALAQYTQTLLRHLPEAQQRQHIVFTNRKEPKNSEYNDGNIRVEEIWTKGSFLYAFQLLQRIAFDRSLRAIHLQHEFNQFGGIATVALIPIWLMIARIFLRKRILITLHEVLGPEIFEPEAMKRLYIRLPPRMAKWAIRIYYKMACAPADTLFVQHEDFRHLLHDNYGIKTHSVLLPIGSIERPARVEREVARKALGIEDNERVAICYGSIDWRKGFDVLVDAFAQLSGDPCYRLLIAGGQSPRIKDDPAFKSWYAALLRRADSVPAVRFLGYLPDEGVVNLFCAADLVVLPYLIPQRASAVLMQTTSYELPFIASAGLVSGLPEHVLCPTTPDELAAKIRWCFDRDHLASLRQFSQAFKKKHTWSANGEAIATEYQQVLSANK